MKGCISQFSPPLSNYILQRGTPIWFLWKRKMRRKRMETSADIIVTPLQKLHIELELVWIAGACWVVVIHPVVEGAIESGLEQHEKIELAQQVLKLFGGDSSTRRTATFRGERIEMHQRILTIACICAADSVTRWWMHSWNSASRSCGFPCFALEYFALKEKRQDSEYGTNENSNHGPVEIAKSTQESSPHCSSSYSAVKPRLFLPQGWSNLCSSRRKLLFRSVYWRKSTTHSCFQARPKRDSHKRWNNTSQATRC